MCCVLKFTGGKDQRCACHRARHVTNIRLVLHTPHKNGVHDSHMQTVVFSVTECGLYACMVGLNQAPLYNELPELSFSARLKYTTGSDYPIRYSALLVLECQPD